jgi:tRNA-splicing ligase RtcB
MTKIDLSKPCIIPTGEATGYIELPGREERVTVIATPSIREGFDAQCLQQAINARLAPGVTDIVLNPDAHTGYGAPIGCVLLSPSHIYPGPVGVDVKCSMSLLQTDLPEEAIREKPARRALINAIVARTPTGAGKGQRSVPKSRPVGAQLGRRVVTEGASAGVCQSLGIAPEWARYCEDAFHLGHDGTRDALLRRLDELIVSGQFPKYEDKIAQLGSYGGGNHFGEANIVHVSDEPYARRGAEVFGLRDGHVAFLSHCGSRGFGYHLANEQFRSLRMLFETRRWALPSGDRHLVYAQLGTPEADRYLDDMALAANFATVNHLLINSLVLEAFREVFPGTDGRVVYFISHNIARVEELDGRPFWVHRKGATRAFPAGHPALAGTSFAGTGHPILLPGNPRDGSVVMAALPGARASLFSVNHGAGRAMGRKAAFRALNQRQVDDDFSRNDILSNCRNYPLDEAPAAYKDFSEVLRSVESAGLAGVVARLKARFVIKDADKSTGGAA